MTYTKTLCTIITLALVGSAGCGKKMDATKNHQSAPQAITISAVPISVRNDPYTSASYAQIAAVVDVDGTRVLAYQYSSDAARVIKAAALIQAELDDGDKDKIQLSGRYTNDEKTDFAIGSVESEKIKINF